MKQIRKAHNLSVVEFAKKLGVSRQTVFIWEKGNVPLSTLARAKLCEHGYIEIETIPEVVNIRVKE